MLRVRGRVSRYPIVLVGKNDFSFGLVESKIGTVGRQTRFRGDAPPDDRPGDWPASYPDKRHAPPFRLEVIAMSDETLRAKTNTAFWMSVAICLAPLVPYALGGSAG